MTDSESVTVAVRADVANLLSGMKEAGGVVGSSTGAVIGVNALGAASVRFELSFDSYTSSGYVF